MPLICYQPKRFGADRLEVISQADAICAEYQAAGYDLTLRQLYYQFVSRGLIENRQSEYKRLGDIVSDARLAGLLDWDYIVDRTRNVRTIASWRGPDSIVRSAAEGYQTDLWADQEFRPEVWIEKDALVGVIERTCERLRVPYFSCRGYTSQSEMWGAGQRMLEHIDQGKTPIVIHLGDHDPSGIDMTRDIRARLAMFAEERVEVRRVALNMDQVRALNPPPNPAKLTDARALDYIARYGESSWELDALDPATLDQIITAEIDTLIDWDVWEPAAKAEEEDRGRLKALAAKWPALSKRWPEVEALLNGGEL